MTRRAKLLLAASALGAAGLAFYSLHDPNASLRTQVDRAYLQSALSTMQSDNADTSRTCILINGVCTVIGSEQFRRQEADAYTQYQQVYHAMYCEQHKAFCEAAMVSTPVIKRLSPREAQATIDAYLTREPQQ